LTLIASSLTMALGIASIKLGFILLVIAGTLVDTLFR